MLERGAGGEAEVAVLAAELFPRLGPRIKPLYPSIGISFSSKPPTAILNTKKKSKRKTFENITFMTTSHTFHIPVMGTAFTADSPLKVAHYGINTVIALADDVLKVLSIAGLKYYSKLKGKFDE